MKKLILRRSNFKIGYFTDTVILIFSFFGSYALRYNTLSGIFAKKQILLFSFLMISWICIIYFIKLYKDDYRKLELNFSLSRLLLALLLQLALLSIFWIVTHEISYSRLRSFNYFSLFFGLGFTYRYIVITSLRYLSHKNLQVTNYIIIGKGEISETIIDYYNAKPENGMRFKGYFEMEQLSNEELTQKLENLILKHNLAFIYCCSPYVSSLQVNKVLEISEKNGVKNKMIMDFEGYFKRGLAIEYHDFIPVVNISKNPPKISQDQFVKRTFDVIFSGVVMILGFPIFYLIGLITKFTSKGPIFYKSERIGHWGQKIYIYKFRSMFTNADEIAQQLLNGDMHSRGDEDPRITKWGQFMRKTRIDELPQFYNVLRGEMTVVGPRPLPEYDLEMIKSVSQTKYNLLISMKPGLTSLGQIKFGYAATTEENISRVNYDLLYLNKYSLKLDLWIIMNTARIMLQAKGR